MPLPELPPGLQRKCDDIMGDLAAQMALLQPAHEALHGRFWQGQTSHASLPADGGEAAPDRSRKVTDCDSWADRGVALPDKMPLAVEVHVYDGPAGKGYVIIGRVAIAGRIWQRALGVGPEARSHDWQDITPERMT